MNALSTLSLISESARSTVSRLDKVIKAVTNRELRDALSEQIGVTRGHVHCGLQRVEHYEITVYGSLMAWARQLGHREVLQLLKANELEEKDADAKLTKIAEATINWFALEAEEGSKEADEERVTQPPRSRRAATAR